MQQSSHRSILEITIISAQDLKKSTSTTVFSRHIRPFITLSNDINAKTYKTRVDDKGGINPSWGDKFRLPFEQFLVNKRCPGIYLRLYTKNFLMGRTQLGWCLIPAADIVSRFSPVGLVHFLSYRLRARDGSRGNGVVNVAVKLEGSDGFVCPLRDLTSDVSYLQEMRDSRESVIGFPVK
ncbi:BON1-associated protein 2 [Striga hermonthica]|uniref:BON1-associated protein 2 n=1 Tax=Striga hermonthica TaxID=68872 RepID=A0A9N7NV16_STRHE|nr:BON1-associated protein 2 [Striga hermonthica]